MTGREIAGMFMLGTVVEVISRPIYGFLSKKVEVRDARTRPSYILVQTAYIRVRVNESILFFRQGCGTMLGVQPRAILRKL